MTTFLPGRTALLLALLSVAACNSKKKDDEAGGPGGKGGKDGGPQPIKDYPVLVVKPDTVTLFQDYPATIQGQQNVEIRPKVDGFVEAIYVDEGASVKKGQKLFHISAPQYEQEVRTARAGIKTAEADVNAARMGVEKVRPLVNKGIISKYQLEGAQYTLQAKEAALAQAQATLSNALTNLGYTTITSPVDGVMGTIPNKIGSLVSSTSADPLTTISSIGSVYAYFSLSEKALLNFARRRPGNTLQDKLANVPDVLLVLADGSVYPYHGRVKTAIGQINTETGASSFRATFPNPQGLLRSGSSGSVRTQQPLDDALIIPQSATYELQGKRFAYVVGRDTAAHAAAITVVPTPDGASFVVQKGLKAGQQVVLEGISGLKEGSKIRPKVVKSVPKKEDVAAGS
ncbi:efflux RND transporter periplasmic adaptor subunit [Hymenobacter sp. DH14]|uniref:Efflux RND transporter periplasmic adaptor subunit n=1 Tax=Hymenobacter cyanobacteriorum TaxID=2926463 RepID=A0A9X1VDV4_9BACT|nr:efflux RND transporter periplasmic adaptor subunit [Hymenobacter cyanobacteriorum]MCI1186720.1 efflux RND transporter periplasmic adaptor subunit [Hymenobacter cyanobacteriorum]